MAEKKFATTAAEQKEAASRLRAKMNKRAAARFDEMTPAQQLELGKRVLEGWGRRDRFGAIDWENLAKIIQMILTFLAPFLVPKKR